MGHETEVPSRRDSLHHRGAVRGLAATLARRPAGSKFAFFGAAPRPSHRANRAGGARCGIYGRVVRRKRKMQPLPQRPVSPSVISIEAEKVRAQGILTRRACERPQGNKPLSFSIPFPCAGMLCCPGSELIGF